jgi:hypothetical protein
LKAVYIYVIFFFIYWAPMAISTKNTAACRLIVRARLLKYPLVPPGAPYAVNDARDL